MPIYISELLMRHLPEKLIFLSTMIMSLRINHTEGHFALLYTAMSHSKMGVSIQYQSHGQWVRGSPLSPFLILWVINFIVTIEYMDMTGPFLIQCLQCMCYMYGKGLMYIHAIYITHRYIGGYYYAG